MLPLSHYLCGHVLWLRIGHNRIQVCSDGGDGDVVVEAIVFQEVHSWTKSMKRNFTAKETADIEFTFGEVKFLDGDIKSQLRVYAY